jgi:uncharacterized membrane protein
MADLLLLKFNSTYGAQNALNAVRALTEMDYAWVDDIAIVERHSSGRVSTHTTHGSVSGGAAWGGLMGMLIGILFPPIGFLALFGVGAATGATIEKLTKETGLDRQMLDEIRSTLDKGTSALLLLGAKGDADQMAKAFEKYEPVSIVRHEIADDTVGNLKDRFDSVDPAVP